MEIKRIVIYPKDIQRITGRSDRYARNLLNVIRKKFNKERYHPITRNEFCEYMKMRPDEIDNYLTY